MEQKTYTFVKNIRGSITFPLESYNMQLPTKMFTIPANVKSIVVPFPYALGLFISTDALGQMELGYFTVNDFESLKAAAIEIGFYPNDSQEEVIKVDDIESKILAGDVEYIKKVINTKNKVYLDNIIAIAQDKYDQLSNGMVRLIEDTCGAELGIDE